MCILAELKKLEVKRCGYFTSLTNFGFLTHLENLLKSTKLAVHFVCFFILLETSLNTSLFTHQIQYLQLLILRERNQKGQNSSQS